VDAAADVCREVPPASGFVGDGDGERDRRHVADVVPLLRIHGEDDEVTGLHPERPRARLGLAAEVDGRLGEHRRTVAAAVFEPVRDAVAARRVGVDHLRLDLHAAGEGALPHDRDELLRHRVNADPVSRDAPGDLLGRARRVRHQHGQVGPLLPPAVDRGLAGGGRGLLLQQLQCDRGDGAADLLGVGVLRQRFDRQHLAPPLQERRVDRVLPRNAVGGRLRVVGEFDHRREVLRGVGERGRVIDLERRAEVSVVAEEQRRLPGRLEPRAVPDNPAGRPRLVGGQVHHHLRLARDRLDRQAKGDRVGRRRVGRHLPRQALGVAAGGVPARLNVVADLDRLPQRRLPRGHVGGQGRHVVLGRLAPPRPDRVERVRGRLVGKDAPELPEVLRVQSLLRRDLRGRERAGGKRSPVADGGEQVRRDRKSAVTGREGGVELPQRGGALVGPVAAGLRRGEPEPVREQHRAVGDVLRGVEVFAEERRRDVGERLGRVREALARGPVGGELTGRPEVHPGEVADGVVVLGVAQPPQRDVARVT
jgi:hypothetical protein